MFTGSRKSDFVNLNKKVDPQRLIHEKWEHVTSESNQTRQFVWYKHIFCKFPMWNTKLGTINYYYPVKAGHMNRFLASVSIEILEQIMQK